MERIQALPLPEVLAAAPAVSKRYPQPEAVPNSYRVMAHRPPILNAFAQLSTAVLGDGTVDRSLKFLVAQMVSRVTGCNYCQAHTGRRAHQTGVDTDKLAALWDFETDDRFDAAERAALRLARDCAVLPNAVTDAHFVELREHFDEPQIVELVSVASFYAFLNRYNDTLANDLEGGAAAWAAEHLSVTGWELGKHAPREAVM